jgi:hypothetical protein
MAQSSQSNYSLITNVQRLVQERLWSKTERFVRRLCACSSTPVGDLALARFEQQEVKAKSGGFKASDFYLIDPSAQVDPMRFIPPAARKTLNPSLLFGTTSRSMAKFPDVRGKGHAEYLLLVLRQLQVGKVVLRTHVAGGGAVFAVGKRDSFKLR